MPTDETDISQEKREEHRYRMLLAISRLADYLQSLDGEELTKVKGLPGLIELCDTVLILKLPKVSNASKAALGMLHANYLPPRKLCNITVTDVEPVALPSTETEQGGGGSTP